jgi:hypothetical protein
MDLKILNKVSVKIKNRNKKNYIKEGKEFLKITLFKSWKFQLIFRRNNQSLDL